MDKSKIKLLVIIPAFNEEASIAAVISDVKKNVPQADILVVDDGSHDSTARTAEKDKVTVISHIFNMGIGATMQTGYKYAKRGGYDIAVQVDADGQHPAEHIPRLLEPILKQSAHIVVGSRFLSRGEYKPSLARSAGMALFSRLISMIIKEKITDTTSGLRAANRECIEFFAGHYPDDYPEVEALVLLHKKGFSIMEVSVTMRERTGGKSSITPVRSVYYMVKVLLAIFVDLLKKVDG